MSLKSVLASGPVLKIRKRIADLRNKLDPYYQIRNLRDELQSIKSNFYYELEDKNRWFPKIMGLEETLRYIIDNKCSMARYGDGEFELMSGGDMSFELANPEMRDRLKCILKNPLPDCLNCVPNIFGSLSRYRDSDIRYWRGAALWMRPILKECICMRQANGGANDYVLGDTQVSRAYLGVQDRFLSIKVFNLWKELFSNKRILIVEGRFSRLGIGNDLFAGASSIKRIWCPANGAFAHYKEILDAIHKNSADIDLIVLALGATATILAYDLAQSGLWAVDAGHVDVEYMWMKMGVTEKTPIPGRYVNECVTAGREQKKIAGEEAENHVVAIIE